MNEIINQSRVAAYKVPTDFPNADGTAQWDSTTMILVELGAGNVSGLGYSYAHQACASVVRESLFPLLTGKNPFDIPALWRAMNRAVRNFGRSGIAASAIAAVEIALWDLKSRLLAIPLVELLGAVRKRIPAYGSGGFVSYPDNRLRSQFENWAASGMTMVKMKIGLERSRDEQRVKAARHAIGKKVELFVDANGAYSPKQALEFVRTLAEYNVSWFEEPVSSDDLDGLHYLCTQGPSSMEIAAGEYLYDVYAARRMLQAQAVDVLQSDATRCGVTGFLEMANLCEAFQIPLSAHTAPALHAHLCCVASRARHVEYFHDHVRIEQLFFQGPTTKHQRGFLEPDRSLPGLGLEFNRKQAEKFQINP